MKIMMKKSYQVKRSYQSIQFSERLINSNLWIAKANELLDVANILKPEVIKYWSEVYSKNRRASVPNAKMVQRQYFLLIAYALENYFKALLIYKNQKSIKNKSLLKLPRWLNAHDIVKLANDVKFNIDVTEECLLFRLSQNSIWEARYPVPTNSDGFITVKKFSNGQVSLTAYFNLNDVSRIDSFIDRLQKHIAQEIKVKQENN